MTSQATVLTTAELEGASVRESLLRVNTALRGLRGTVERRPTVEGRTGWRSRPQRLSPRFYNGSWHVGGASERLDDISSVSVQRRDGGQVVEVTCPYSLLILDVDDPPRVA